MSSGKPGLSKSQEESSVTATRHLPRADASPNRCHSMPRLVNEQPVCRHGVFNALQPLVIYWNEVLCHRDRRVYIHMEAHDLPLLENDAPGGPSSHRAPHTGHRLSCPSTECFVCAAPGRGDALELARILRSDILRDDVDHSLKIENK